jgi:hypothetical protein
VQHESTKLQSDCTGLLEDIFRSILALLRGDSISLSQNVLTFDVGRTNVNDNVLQQLRLSYLSIKVTR